MSVAVDEREVRFLDEMGLIFKGGEVGVVVLEGGDKLEIGIVIEHHSLILGTGDGFEIEAKGN